MNNNGIITEVDFLDEQLKSYKYKKRGNFKWLERMGEHFYHSNSPSRKYINNININVNLLKGKGITRDNIREWANTLQSDLGVGFDYENVPHHDIVGFIGKSMEGYQRKRSWNPGAIDTGPEEGNSRKEETFRLTQEWIQKKLIPAYMERASVNVMQRHGVQNPMDLSPEEQQQLQFEIQQETEVLTPTRIRDYMRNNYSSPTSKTLQELLDFLSRDLDLKFETDNNFVMALTSGMEIYYSGIRGDQLVFENVNPRGFIFGDYPTCKWIQDSMYTVYRQDLPAVEVISRYGNELTVGELKRMAKVGSSYQEYNILENARLIGEIDDSRELDHINLRTNEGQQEFRRIKREYGAAMYTNIFETTHITFKSLDKAKFVTRKINGKKRGFYVGSNYEFNPLKGDVEIRDVTIPIAFECTRIQMGGDYTYVGKGPIEYSYRSIENPYRVTLPYIGGIYNKMQGMDTPVSQMDLGKPGQLEYNYVKAKMEEDRSTDYGKILPIIMSLKPEEYTEKEWINTIKHEKLLIIGEEAFRDGRLDTNQLQMLRGIDLSTADKIQSRLLELEAIRQNTARAMGYNENMMGQASPYESISNNRQNISLSMNQTQSVYSYHDKIVENALTHLLQNAIIYYRDKPIQRSYILSDISVASMDLELDNFPPVLAGVFLSNSPQDAERLEIARNSVLPFVQNQLLDAEDSLSLSLATSIPELYNIVRNATEKNNRRQAEMHQRRMEELDKQAKIEEQKSIAEHAKEIAKIDRKNVATLQAAELNAQTLERANDVNRDMINDADNRQFKDLAYKREKDALDRELERELKRLDLEMRKNTK